MDPITLMILALSSQLAQSDLIVTLAKQLGNKLTNAKREYESTPKDSTSPIEQKRESLLGTLSELQTQVILYMSKQPQFTKIMTIILDQTAETYEAQTNQDLKMIEMSVGHIKGAVKQYQKIAARRVVVRWLAVIVSIIALVGLGGIIYWGTLGSGPSLNTILPVIQVPLPILLWSAIGSFTAILYRFNSSGDIELQDPLRWLFTRPITGIVMGVIAYFVVLVGLVSITSGDATASKNISSAGSTVILWLVAFISGFSDRFADGLLRTLIGRFGGNAQEDLVTLGHLSDGNLSSLLESLPTLSDLAKKRKKAGTNTSGATDTDVSIDKLQNLLTSMQQPTAQSTNDTVQPTIQDNESTE